jgi:hypothetical protein
MLAPFMFAGKLGFNARVYKGVSQVNQEHDEGEGKR